MKSKLGCESCGVRNVCRESNLSWLFFFIGILATVALRIIGPLNSISPIYAKISWYVGVLGFLLFFIYKYQVLRRRYMLIRESGLKDKLSSSSALSDMDYHILAEIICSQDNWKERTNFLVIFVLSGVALFISLFFDFIL